MKDPFEEYLNGSLLSKENVLREVDDYSLYCHYIGTDLELRTKYSSPIRRIDSDPSFSLYYGKRGNLMFKDHGINETGDVILFLRLFFGGGDKWELRKTLLQLNSDLKLGFDGEDVPSFTPEFIKKPPPLKKSPAVIQITKAECESAQFVDYWNFLNVGEDIRRKYKIYNPNLLHFIQDNKHSIVHPKTLCISYEILGTYKIYQPFEDKLLKFRNNYKRNYVEGMLQLDSKADLCIITKSTKEIAFFRANFNWNSVAGPSESIMISDHSMKILQERFPTIIIWLDNDDAGKKATSKYLEKYPFLIPVDVDKMEAKDPTDLFTDYKNQGKEEYILNFIKTTVIATWQNYT